MQQRTRNGQTAQLSAGKLTTAFSQPAVQSFVLKQLLQSDLLQYGAKIIV